MAGVAVELRDVTKAYPLGDGRTLTAVDHVSLRLPAGSRTALVGASGSGKSTLLHLMGGLDVADSGTIIVGDREITKLKPSGLADYRSSVGFVFQQFHLIPALSLLDNVCSPLIGKYTVAERRERGMELLESVGLAGRAKALPSQLSGGQRQRVAIARALVVQPDILLADEPTGNLDSHTGAEILELFADLHNKLGLTMVIATHDLGVAETCDRIIRVSDGRASMLENQSDTSYLEPSIPYLEPSKPEVAIDQDDIQTYFSVGQPAGMVRPDTSPNIVSVMAMMLAGSWGLTVTQRT